MKVTSEKTGSCEYTLTIEVEQSRTQKALANTGREVTRRAPIPGFRPGKAPYKIIENYFGKEVMYNRTLEKLGPEVYEEALKEAGLEPYAQGNLDIEEYEPLTLKVVVPVVPVVELGDYRAIRVDKTELDFNESEIEDALLELQQRRAEWHAVERAAQEGDQVTLNLTGTADGEEVFSQTSRKTLVTSGMYPKGLFEHVVGIEPGGSAEYTVGFDEDDTNPQFAGKTVSFHLEVSGINEKKLPELNDEFAKAVGGDYENLEALRKGIRDSLHTSKEDEAREEITSSILLALLEDAKLEYPAVAVEREIDVNLYELKQRIQTQGFSWESFLNTQHKTEDELRDESRQGAEQNLRESLVLAEVAKREGLQVAEEEIEAEVGKLLEPYGPQAAIFRPIYDNDTNKLSIRRRLLLNKAVDWLIAAATGDLPEADAKDADSVADVGSDESLEATENEGAPAPEAGTE